MPETTYTDYQDQTLTVKVKLEFERDGERKQEEHRVVYRAVTDELAEEIDSLPPEQRTLSHQLNKLVVALPDMPNGDGPVKPTVEFFRKMSPRNKRAINTAIEEDSYPK